MPIRDLTNANANFAWANQLPPQQIIPKLKREDLAFTLKDIENKIEEAFKKYETDPKKPLEPKRVSKSVAVCNLSIETHDDDTQEIPIDELPEPYYDIDELPDEYDAEIPEQYYIP